MIADHQTNKLFLADCLEHKHPVFFKEFQNLLVDCGIPFDLLPDTKDIWAVDYMPVQKQKNQFIQFRYEPDYLMDNKKHRSTISDVDGICKAIGIHPAKSNINLDGGNVTKWTDRVILCEKVFRENLEYSKEQLREELIEIFGLQEAHLHFVPEDKYDFTGHADGMVRFVDERKLLINDYSQENRGFRQQFKKSIDDIGLDFIEIPYIPEDSPDLVSAVGLYLNYLEMEQAVIVPVFNLPSDEEAVKVIRNIFKEKPVRTLQCNELAKHGGILNCITWNILA